jgi:hypothetical protein
MATVTISKKDVEEHLQRLAKIRPPEDRPTEKQVIEMLLRMKKRWGLL